MKNWVIAHSASMSKELMSSLLSHWGRLPTLLWFVCHQTLMASPQGDLLSVFPKFQFSPPVDSATPAPSVLMPFRTNSTSLYSCSYQSLPKV